MRHGTTHGYSTGCRCVPCSKANARYLKLWRSGYRASVPAIGTQRRLQALGAAGWTFRAIGEYAGLDSKSLTDILARPTVYRSTATTIRRIYLELRFKDGGSNTARGRAKAKGRAPAYAWDERTIDDPQAKPRMPVKDKPMKRADYLEEYLNFLEAGYSKHHAANRLGVSVEWLEGLRMGYK